MPPSIEPPVDEREFLDWAFDRAMELVEDGHDGALEDLLNLRPSLQDQIRQMVDLARKVAFGPKTARPVLPGFELIEQLGEGGMGTVWLARQHKLGGRLVALKIMARSLVSSPRSRSRFRAEAQAIGKLRHPNIVDVYDVIEADDLQAYAMEWVEGSTLARIIDKLKSVATSRHGNESSMNCVHAALGARADAVTSAAGPADRNYILFICRIGVAIGRALGVVHNSGLVHRDVKPSNILIRRDGTPLLSDFGLVREFDSSIVTQAGGEFAGTAAFAAPEQLRADGGDIDGRADVYALGATLYAALAQRQPFGGHDHVEVLRRIQLGLAQPLRKFNPKIPRDLQTIVAKAMETDPERRYPTADELADDLDRLLNLQPIWAKPAGWLTRTGKLVRRNRKALGAAMAGVALTIGGTVLILVYALGFPKWSKEHFSEARLVLIDPEQSDALFSALFFRAERAGGLPIAPNAVDRAIEHYDAAARFAPFDASVALEREVVEIARNILQRPRAGPIDSDLARGLPLTSSFAAHVYSGWSDFKNVRDYAPFDATQFESASTEDLRSLGLLALLCGDPTITVSAWTAFDLKGGKDGLVDASFGMVHLISRQYGRAYPRLQHAVEAFPNVGFLTVYLAEAATKCGDFEKAQRWLDEAASMPRLDRFNGWKRVQAGLHAATGHNDDARRLYEELLTESLNIVAFDEYAQFLETQGEIEHALLIYLRTLGHGLIQLPLFQRFVDATERWWTTLEESDRQALIRAYEPWTAHRDDRNGILPTYDRCIRALGIEPRPDGIPRSPSKTGLISTRNTPIAFSH